MGLAIFTLAGTSPAQTAAPAVTITGHYDNAVGTSDAASQGVIEAALLKSRPALRPGEVLEFVPGVIVTQHSGDGKANQYFLRGFNLDQFKQTDSRSVYGLNASRSFDHTLAGWDARSEVGLQLRHDRIRVGLYDTVARQITATTREDEVRETQLGIHGQTALQFTPLLRGIFGLRGDRIDNRVDALTLPENTGDANATQLSPKLSLVADPYAKTEFLFNAGRGMHSNDARGTTITRDPRTGDPADKVPPLVSSRGFEFGARTEALPGLQSSLALWKLDFDTELVYVGDAGATEASAASTRKGIEFNNRWAPVAWFLLDADFAWTHARFVNGDRIPNSVERVASVAATLRELGPWSASLQWRYLGSGPLIEDNSVRSEPAITTNLRLARNLGGNTELTLDVFNLLDRKVNDIQYFYESQLPGETAPVSDRHVHPAEPRTVRVSLASSSDTAGRWPSPNRGVGPDEVGLSPTRGGVGPSAGTNSPQDCLCPASVLVLGLLGRGRGRRAHRRLDL